MTTQTKTQIKTTVEPIAPRKGPAIDSSKFIGRKGLNKKHLEMELLLEDGKEFTWKTLMVATREKHFINARNRMNLLCKMRGYKLHKIRSVALGKGPLTQVFKLLKDGDET